MTRPYRRIGEPAIYWNIRVPERDKKRAKVLGKKLGLSSPEIARRAMSKGLLLLEDMADSPLTKG